MVVPISPDQRFNIDAMRSGAYADRDKVLSSINIAQVCIKTLPQEKPNDSDFRIWLGTKILENETGIGESDRS